MCELPLKMASLHIVEEDEMTDQGSEHICGGDSGEVSSSPIGRVLRKKNTTPCAPSYKRRCKLAPKKYPINPDGSQDSVEDLATLYTSKGTLGSKPFKCLLETIYEEPVRQKNGPLLSVGIRKIKRTITFPKNGLVSKTKQRIRKKKSLLLVSKFLPKKSGDKRASLDRILSELAADENDESPDNVQYSSTSCFSFNSFTR